MTTEQCFTSCRESFPQFCHYFSP